MHSVRPFWLLLIALLVLSFGLAAGLDPRFQAWRRGHDESAGALSILLGDSRRMFANYFYIKADIYYHSGYYPSIFDNHQNFETPHMAADTGTVASHNQATDEGFMGPPRDWIDAFGRHFIPNRHTHLDQGGPTEDLSHTNLVGEILPWLELSAELAPHNIQTYTVTAFWLRGQMHEPKEAEAFLREGLRHNPGNPSLLYELGRVYFENRHDLKRARLIWEAALRGWVKQMNGQSVNKETSFESRFIFEQLETHLGQLEEQAGNYQKAIGHWELAKKVAPDPAAIQKQIDELRQKLPRQSPKPAPSNP